MAEKVKNGITEIVFIIDRSGSMTGMEADTIGGFNSMIDKYKKSEGKFLVSTVLFSNKSTIIHDRIDVKQVEPMTFEQYCVGGMTALLDAIGGAIHHIGNVHKYARKEDVPEHTIFVITTDGMENASCEYSSDKVKSMIDRQQEKYGWEFLFVAANIDAVETAESIGIRRERAANYRQTKRGTRSVYQAVESAIEFICEDAPITDNWKDKLDDADDED